MGTGTYEEALAWLEYCNGTGDTYWANLRRKNTGRHEPHNVKLWGLGNEMHGAWQVGALSATDYAKKAYRWAHGLRLVDPSIQLVSCGNQVRPVHGTQHLKVTLTLRSFFLCRATRSGIARSFRS